MSMKRLPWPALLLAALGACRAEPVPRRLHPTGERAAVVERRAPVDPVVDVEGPTTVYVIQDRRVRALIEWPHQERGRVTVPVGAVDDGSGPLFVGARKGPITKNRFGAWNTDWC